MDISEITDYLFISSRVTKKNVAAVLDLDPRLVISMIFQRRPPQELALPSRQLLWLRTFDFPLIPIPVRTLHRGVEAALPIIEEGYRVHVFCEGGRRRSVALASCILIGKGYSADEAMRLIKEQREVAKAYGECAHHIEGLTFGRERVDVSDQVDAMLPVMSCLREKDYDADDPTVDTFQQWAIDFRSTFDWDDPDAAAAYEECVAE